MTDSKNNSFLTNLYFINSLKKNPEHRTTEDLLIIRDNIEKLESFRSFSDVEIYYLCKIVRYEKHEAVDVLYSTGEPATCFYVLISGSVYIDSVLYFPPVSFGQKSHSLTRSTECLVMETSEMMTIHYREMQPIAYNHQYTCDMNSMSDNLPSNRNSQASDNSSSSAYSGSITSLEASYEHPDLNGLPESAVDSDEEEFSPSNTLNEHDRVKECLEKDPSDRSENDIDILLEFTQHLKAFQNMTLNTRRELCKYMIFAVVEKLDTVVMNDNEELDSWSVLISGEVEIKYNDGSTKILECGDSFGTMTKEKLFHEGVMRTKTADCQFVCVTQDMYCHIRSMEEKCTKRHRDENGQLCLVTENYTDRSSGCEKVVVLRGTEERLIAILMEEAGIVDKYIDDFLLTFRTFIKDPCKIANQLLEWFDTPIYRERASFIFTCWVNYHFVDFESNGRMMKCLENFIDRLDFDSPKGSQYFKLLRTAFDSRSKERCLTLTRSDKHVALNFKITEGFCCDNKLRRIFISEVEPGSKAEEIGLKKGDKILSVNSQNFRDITKENADAILGKSTHLSITCKYNIVALKIVEKTNQRGTHMKDNHVTGTKLKAKSGGHHQPILGCESQNVEQHTMSLKPINLPKTRMKMPDIVSGLFPKQHKSHEKLNAGSLCDNTDTHDVASSVSINQSDPLTVEDQNVTEIALKVYKSDQSFKYIIIHKSTTAHEVVMLSLKKFGMTEPSSLDYILCEVSVSEEGSIRRKQLSDDMCNLAERQQLCSRYYLKLKTGPEIHIPADVVQEMQREGTVSFLNLKASEVALQLAIRDFEMFKQVESTEHIDDIFKLKSAYGTPNLDKFAQLVDREMFWVVTEICSEMNLVKRSKIIKQFIKIARYSKDIKNFNSFFSILLGLEQASVKRLKQSWEKVSTKYTKSFTEMFNQMDPSNNMAKYRNLINLSQKCPPVIPFYPVVRKDITFLNDGNESIIEGLINFEKLRMIASEIHKLTHMKIANYGITVADNNVCSTKNTGLFTVRRKKDMSNPSNLKKLFEEMQMVRRAKAYLHNVVIISDEKKLQELSLNCEPGATSTGNSMPMPPPQKKVINQSPTLSTASSASSASEGRRARFGTSPQNERRLLALSESTRPRHQSKSASQNHMMGRFVRPPVLSPSTHERSYSDTQAAHHFQPPGPPMPVRLSVESSSVTSLSNSMYRRNNNNSGNSSRSNSSVSLDTHSNSSTWSHGVEGNNNAALGGHVDSLSRYYPNVLPSSHGYHHGRSYSHEGVSSTFRPPNPVDDDDETQVSAV